MPQRCTKAVNPTKKKEGKSVASALPRSTCPAKITPKAQHAILKQVKRDPRVTAKHLLKSLQPAKIFMRPLGQKKEQTHCSTS